MEVRITQRVPEDVGPRLRSEHGCEHCDLCGKRPRDKLCHLGSSLVLVLHSTHKHVCF